MQAIAYVLIRSGDSDVLSSVDTRKSYSGPLTTAYATETENYSKCILTTISSCILMTWTELF